ncbi:MAG: hypothetical protein Tsb009_14970 [Planctomycetaceae bacterium]
MNSSLVYLAVLVSAPAAEETQSVYTFSPAFEAVIRSQSPGYDEVPKTNGNGPSMTGPPQTYVVPNGSMITPQPGYIAGPGADPFLAQQNGLLPGAGGDFAGLRYGANGPQPYRLNQWVSRYNFGILPKESTSQGLGNFGIFEFDGDWEFATPSVPGWIFSFAQQFNVRSWDGPTGSAMVPTTALPGSVFRFGWNFELATPANNQNPWGLSLTFNPSLNSDLERSLSSNAWNFDGHGMIFYHATPQWTWVLGAGFWDRVKDRVIPYAGFVWTPDDRWEIRAVLPEPRISYFIGRIYDYSTWWYTRAEYHVEAYELQLETTGAREKVELEDYRILMGLRFDNGWYSSFIEGGWVFGRNVRFLNGTPGFDVSTGFIGRVGLRY